MKNEKVVLELLKEFMKLSEIANEAARILPMEEKNQRKQEQKNRVARATIIAAVITAAGAIVAAVIGILGKLL